MIGQINTLESKRVEEIYKHWRMKGPLDIFEELGLKYLDGKLEVGLCSCLGSVKSQCGLV